MVYALFHCDNIYNRATLLLIENKVAKSMNPSFKEELVSYVFNPERLISIAKIYNIDFIDVMESLCD
jgi:hypothetical protein